MVTETEVEYAYRLMLGREPESANLVSQFAGAHSNLSALREAFWNSPEFQQKITGQSVAPRPAHEEPLYVETEADETLLNRLLEHIEDNWRRMGDTEPHWSVITDEQFRSSSIENSETQFYDTGKENAELFALAAARCGIKLSSDMVCFELGCGVGRVSVWLSKLFDSVIAADISQSHLKLAREAALHRKCLNVQFKKLGSMSDFGSLPRFDAFYSVIVLQHNPPPVMGAILREIFAALRPGGVAYFQIPTYCRNYSFSVSEYLRSAEAQSGEGRMEMHVFPQKDLIKLIYSCGAEVLEIREDNWTGSIEMISNSLLVRKL